MNTQQLLESSALGLHLLFDREQIAEAFEQDGSTLRLTVEAQLDAIQDAVKDLLDLPDARAGRQFIAGLPRPVQHVLVLLYFELLDGLVRRRNLTLH